jgi:hypothetical protein
MKAVARRITARNRVQQDYAMLSTIEVGKFREALLDEKAEMAFLMLVVEKHEPTPLEMQDQDLANQRYGLAQQAARRRDELLGYDALAKRFRLQRFDEPAAGRPSGAPEQKGS